MPKTTRTGPRGFTVLELAVVLVILVFMVTVMVPRQRRERDAVALGVMRADLARIDSLQAARRSAGLPFVQDPTTVSGFKLSSSVTLHLAAADSSEWTIWLSGPGERTSCQAQGGLGRPTQVQCGEGRLK